MIDLAAVLAVLVVLAAPVLVAHGVLAAFVRVRMWWARRRR